jgi:hypothetical protein
VLRGGRVGRRLRVKAILLSSARRPADAFRLWINFEAVKGILLVLVVIAPLHFLGLPLWVTAASLIAAMGWMAFVLAQTTGASMRLSRRHAAYMKAVGVDTNLRSVLGDAELWRKSPGNMTLRDFIAERRRKPPLPRSRPPA